MNWYLGTTNLSYGQNEDQELNDGNVYRRLGDLYTNSKSKVDPKTTWYTPDHANFEHGGKDEPWEGIGTGWFYSVLGGGYDLRSPVTEQRTSVKEDNTIIARMRGDFAVPTLFNGNFDAIAKPLSSTLTPGWSNKNDKKIQAYLKKGIAGNQTYALELGTGLNQVTHDNFMVPDWGTLRFDLHVRNLNVGKFNVKVNSSIPKFKTYTLGTINLTEAIGTPAEYLDDRYRIGYGTSGFETFHLDLPDELRGQVISLTFELAGRETVYLDNVFFRSEHLLFGNPSDARKPNNAELFRNNYLLEKPQYVISYDADKQTANWAAHKLNQTWIGSDQKRTFKPDSTLPLNWYQVNTLDYKSTGYDRGHLVALQDKTRIPKDRNATNLMTNIVPQAGSNNRNFWSLFEIDLRDELVDSLEKELYLVTGGTGTRGQINKPSNPTLNINIPESIWKMVLVLDQPGLTTMDIGIMNSIPLAFAVYVPNDTSVPVGKDDNKIPGWRQNTMYIRSVRQLEGLTGYNFLSELPINIQNQIEDRNPHELLQIINQLFGVNPTSSLLASTELNVIGHSQASIITDTTILHDSSTEDRTSQSKLKIIGTSPQEISISKIGNTNSFFQVHIPQVGFTETGTEQVSTSQNTTMQISTIESSSIQTGPIHLSFSQIGFIKDSPNSITFERSPLQITSIESSSNKIGPSEINLAKIRSSQIRPNQISEAQVGIGEVNFSKISIDQFNFAKTNPTEISITSLVPSEQFFSIHDTKPQIINNINNSATNIWSDLLQTETSLDITFQITDLPTGQLAEATITGFDPFGRPNAGTILIDYNANGIGWFIDSTPFESSEFGVRSSEFSYNATPNSEAYGKYDLLTTVLHEIAHLYGFIQGYEPFDHLHHPTAIIDGSHLDNHAHPNDLLNSHLAPGIRKLPSDLNIEILKAIIASEGNPQAESNLEALLTSTPLLAAIPQGSRQGERANGDFSISDPNHPHFGWTTRGATTILNGQALLTEGSPFLSNLSQTFIVPEGSKTLQFTLVDAQLGATQFFPSDAFEVALLDAHSLTSLVDTIDELSFTDAFLNLQNTGTTYLGDDVQLPHATGNSPRTFFIDISHLTLETEATLFFDLLGFGDNDSRVSSDRTGISPRRVCQRYSTQLHRYYCKLLPKIQ
ncbi:MAG: DNA/RNA non-specific endonuclease [Cyanobacteria bacterium P01_G01_bin.49]